MIRHICIYALLLTAFGAMAQTNDLDRVLQCIEANNPEIRANAQLISAQRLEGKSENNLADPTVSYSHLWASGNESITELEVAQEFDFPTLYAQRRTLNRIKGQAFDSREEIVRRDILLEAKGICYDVILLRKQKAILDERLKNAQELATMYARRLEQGDANILETNKINIELLNVKTEAALNETALRNKLTALRQLNGNMPVDLAEADYPLVSYPNDFALLKAEVLSADHALLALEKESEAARKQVSINKAGLIPKLQVGYRRNTESGTPFNGVMVGMSIPLFENRHKVKMAKAQSVALEYQKESAAMQLEAQLRQLYEEAGTIRASMHEYEQVFAAQSDLELLKKALLGGEISMIEYFVEVSSVHQTYLSYLQLQNQYHKAMADMYKNRL